MGTSDGEGGSDSELPPAWPEERGTDAGVAPSFWPRGKTEAVLSEAATGDFTLDEPLDDPLWERWYERAMEAGVEEDLARLGRTLIRAARRLRWDRERAVQSGWLDEGEAMLELALKSPDQAEMAWQALLDA